MAACGLMRVVWTKRSLFAPNKRIIMFVHALLFDLAVIIVESRVDIPYNHIYVAYVLERIARW